MVKAEKSIFLNDIVELNQKEVEDFVEENSHFSFSYVVLLLGSTIVTTLGLLLGSSPVVIGGMIISPLMWPLMKISSGVSFGKGKVIQEGIILLAGSLFLILLASVLITLVSPIRLINEEIYSRANPTLIDLIVALAAGGVASLAIVQPRMSESLAGVAVATSLTPPVCVSGIGLALFNLQLSLGGLMLFFANVIAIIFVSIIVFSLIDVKKNKKGTAKTRKRGIIIVSIALVFISVPLFLYLQNYAFRSIAIKDVQNILETELKVISPSIELGSVQTDVLRRNSQDLVDVRAEVQLPEEIIIDFQQKQTLVDSLEKRLDAKVDLSLILSRIISIVSEEDLAIEDQKNKIQEIILEEIKSLNNNYNIDQIVSSLETEDKPKWIIEVAISGDPLQNFTLQHKNEIQKRLAEELQIEIDLNIKITPQLQLISNPGLVLETRNQDIQEIVTKAFENIDQEIEVRSIRSIDDQNNKNKISVFAEIIAPQELEISDLNLEQVKFSLEVNFEDYEFELDVRLIRHEIFQLD